MSTHELEELCVPSGPHGLHMVASMGPGLDVEGLIHDRTFHRNRNMATTQESGEILINSFNKKGCIYIQTHRIVITLKPVDGCQ